MDSQSEPPQAGAKPGLADRLRARGPIIVAALQLAGIVCVAIGVGWAVHPGIGLAAGGALLYLETFFGVRR